MVQLNHTIVNSQDKEKSARFLAELLGVADPTPYGPFLVVQVADVSLALDPDGHILEIITRPYGG